MKRNDIAWWIVTRTLRHVATEEFGNNVINKLAGNPADYERIFYPKGTILRSKCFGCPTVFTQTVLVDQDIPTMYHSRACQHKNRNDKKHKPAQGCPTPHKISYPSHERAQAVRGLLAKENRKQLENQVYHCQCKRFHLGHGNFEVIKEGTWGN